MSNSHNNNWSGNNSAYVPAEVLPRPLCRAMRFSFREYLLAVSIGAFVSSIYAGIQAVHRLSANTHTSPTSAPQHRQLHPLKGTRP